MFLFSENFSDLDKPLRAELLSRDAMVARAVELAEFYSASSDKREKGVNLRARFKKNTKDLQSAYFQFSLAAKNKEGLTAGAEWLLDNYHILDQQVKEIANDLPRSYYRSLPKLVDREWKGFPRVYRVISEFLAHTDSVIDIDLLSSFIQAYQSRLVLKIGELWAVPIMLRLCLVENLRRLANASLATRKHRLAAEALCEEILASTKIKGSEVLVNLVKRVGDDAHVIRDSGAYILRRLRARGSATTLALQWFDAKLRELHLDPEVLSREEQQAQAADQISFGNCVTSLKIIASIDWHEWFEKVSHVDTVLSRDKIYARCDFNTRDLYRRNLELLAEKAQVQQVEVAERLVDFAAKSAAASEDEDVADYQRRAHVGFYLIDQGYAKFESELQLKPDFLKTALSIFSGNALITYLSALTALTASIVIYLLHSYGFESSIAMLAYALILPSLCVLASESAVLIVQWICTQLTKSYPLPKLNFEKGISAEFKTCVVVQSILSPHSSVDEMVEALEIRALANLDPHLSFGLLLDFQDSDVESLQGDRGLINQIESRISDLNAFYPRDQVGTFFALCRRRTWNQSESKFMGWERKRGKIEEFNRFLRGDTNTNFIYQIGDFSQIRQSRFVITLDSDTKLPPGTARKLIATMSHPLNRPSLDNDTRIVKRGYSILQPRMGICLESALSTRFSAAFSGQSGIDPYTQTVSDLYQDLFKEGSYIGKGIYDVDAFEAALENRVPENSLLSHDLFEGCFAKSGLVSDVELLDEFPARYHQQSRRQLRWIRGDWQLLPFMFSSIKGRDGKVEKTPLSALSRWKLIDNLRRSLVPIAAFLTLLFASLLENPFQFALAFIALWTVPVFLTLISSSYDLVRQIFQELFEIGSKQSLWGSIWATISELRRILSLCFYQFVVIPHQACLSIEAIFVTLYRLFVSKANLLEWETAFTAQRRLGADFKSFLKTFALASSICLLAVILFARLDANLYYLAALLCLWLSAPAVMWFISQEQASEQAELSPSNNKFLIDVAFDTWNYFATFLCKQYNYLIPDNLQLVPNRVVAERTSPTNISLSCLSVLSAHDLGFISGIQSIRILKNVFTSLAELERFQGHFLNWYDIKTMASLRPRYVSTVDSGNLLGHFVAVRQGLRQIVNSSLLSQKHIQFLSTKLDLSIDQNSANVDGILKLIETISLRSPPEVTQNHLLQKNIGAYLNDLESVVGWARHLPVLEALASKGLLNKRLKNISKLITGRPASITLLLKLTNRLLTHKEDFEKLELLNEERDQLSALIQALESSNQILHAIVTEGEYISSEVSRYLNEADFKFLTHAQKPLFVIGYNIDTGLKDSACYDLLASEARLASLVAISEGKMKTSHWFLLGRALTDSLGGKALLSWSATMFEYLMPLLVTRDYRGTLLNRTHHSVVRAQISYGNLRGVPWGISESAFSGVDFEKTYQYRAFGLPGLGYKRGLGEDLVISPYSTALALMVDAKSALHNLRRLENEGLRGEFGFYEAADYTRERLGADEDKHIIRSFLAHHQGMSLIAINNLLNSGIIQNRFHADPKIQAVEILLQERFPDRLKSLVPHRAEKSSTDLQVDSSEVDRSEKIPSAHTQYPFLSVLSNPRYSTMVSNSGSGVSVFDGDFALNRWFSDSLQDCWGQFVYVRDLVSGKFWSTTYQPSKVEPNEYEVIYNPDKIETIRKNEALRTKQELVVSPEDPVEVKRISVTNLAKGTRRVELTSFAEVALANALADKAHLAFSKLFLETEFLSDYDALLVQRKPRSHSEKTIWMFHLVSMPIVWAPVQFETDRTKFIGRSGDYSQPVSMSSSNKLSGSVGTVLDPCISLRAIIEVESGFTQQVSFITGAANTREEALSLIKKYHESYHIVRAFEMAWSHADVEIRDQQFTLKRIRNYQLLGSALIYNVDALRAPKEIIAKCNLPQSALWRLGISGDEPICLLVISDAEQTKILEEVLLAHEYLRRRGLTFDLVILNESAAGYLQNLRDEIDFLVNSSYARSLIDKRGGIFVRSLTQLSEEEQILLRSVARVSLSGDRGSFSQQLKLAQLGVVIDSPRKSARLAVNTKSQQNIKVSYPNGLGDFSSDGKAYQIVVSPKHVTPQPWSNIVANPKFGFLTTERGSGYTWAGNSRENRLTPWSNDPVLDPPGEVVYIRDVDTGVFWSATPAPASMDNFCKVEHGFGYSSYDLEKEKIHTNLTLTASTQDSVKYFKLNLENKSSEARRIEVYFYVEWVLGVNRESSFRYLQTKFLPKSQVLLAKNPWNAEFANQQVFIGSNLSIQSYTCSRPEFIGRHGDLALPRLFEENRADYSQSQILPSALSKSLSSGRSWPVILKGSTGAGFDSCGLIKVQIILEPHAKTKVLFFLGHAEKSEDVESLAHKYKSLSESALALQSQKAYWENILGTLKVKTPNKDFNTIMNGWLLYQTIACRMFARTGFFQSSGAFGFRDQLQDSSALLWSWPQKTREQLLLNASRQFKEGDVQHWWHPPAGRGIRTNISDGYIWMPYVLTRYLKVTGDNSILDEIASYLEGPVLEQNQMEHYFEPSVSQERETLYQHCVRALDRSLVVGPKGLPLMGCGDWNDGMNQVGYKGQGESVWLAWFLAITLRDFAEVAKMRGDIEIANRYSDHSRSLVAAIEAHSWDGEWYHRAYFDDGTVLGSKVRTECRIDSLAQSWAAISGMANSERVSKALNSVYENLVDKDSRIVKLLTPPFQHSDPSPGYIQGYPPGIRENGGQYTHGSTWAILAYTLIGDGAKAFELFDIINPITHGNSVKGVAQYQTEPYVTCGDVYSHPEHSGRGGWSWYTGSSGWLYQIGLEGILGLAVEGNQIKLNPCIPPEWKDFELEFRYRSKVLQIKVLNPESISKGVKSLKVDGKESTHIDISELSAEVVNVECILG
jgi:cyclic beta-1,2-glucan synthetase